MANFVYLEYLWISVFLLIILTSTIKQNNYPSLQIILAKIKQSVQLVYYLSFYFPVTSTMTMKDMTTYISIITYNIPEKSNGIINKRNRSTTCNYTFVKTLFQYYAQLINTEGY